MSMAWEWQTKNKQTELLPSYKHILQHVKSRIGKLLFGGLGGEEINIAIHATLDFLH